MPLQGFIQALLLTSIFHEGLSFIVVGHNPMYASTLALAAWVHMWCCKPTLWGPGPMPLDALAILPIPDFQIAFPCIIQ